MTRSSLALFVFLLASPAAAQPSMAAEALIGARVALAENAPGRAFELARLARQFDETRSLEAWELMGRARAEMGERAAAHRFFRRALAIADHTEQTRLLARMQLARDELGLVRVDLQPGGATLFVDGVRAEYERGTQTLLLRPGARQFEARLEGHEPRTAIVHVTPGGSHSLRIVLPDGAEDRVRMIPRPSREHAGRRWLTGNAILIGVGTLSMTGAGAAQRSAPETLNEAWSFQLGLSSGLALGSALNMILQQALDVNGHGSLLIWRLAATPVLIAAALAVASGGWLEPVGCETDNERCQRNPAGAAGAVGTLAGIAISTMANIGLGDADVPIATSLGVAFTSLALVEGVFAFDASQSAALLRDVGRPEDAANFDTMATVTGGLSLGFVAIAAWSFALGFAGGEDELDLSVSAGPGTLTVSGHF